MEEPELLAQYAETGSEAAFRKVAEQYSGMVYSVCMRQLADPGLAEDATQAVFIALARKARRFSKKTIISAWLFKAAKYACSKTIRSRIRREKYEKEAGQMALSDTDSCVSWGQISPHLDDALMSLSGTGRSATILRYFEGKSYADIGKRIGISEDAAKMRVSRSVEKMRKYFSKKGITVSPAVLPLLIKDNGMHAVPPGLAESCCRAAAAGTRGEAAVLVGFENANHIANGVMKMMMWAKMKIVAACAVLTLSAGFAGLVAIETIAASASEPTGLAQRVILSERSYWRCYYVYGTDLVRMPDEKMVNVHPANLTKLGKKTVDGKKRFYKILIPYDSTEVWGAPHATWASPDFDDSTWPRLRGPFMIGPYRTPQFGYRSIPMACLRSKFRITEPADGFKLSVGYHGGIVVFLNGKEILRKHLPEGELKPETQAEEYPLDVFVDVKGKALSLKKIDKKSVDRYENRIRTIQDFPVPAGKLRKGMNVLAIELHRAPAPEVMFTSKHGSFSAWSRIGLALLGLTGPVDASESALGRPAGFQVWSVPVYEEVGPADYGDPSEGAGLVRLCTGRGGVVSGQVVAGSPTPFKGLDVKLSDLKGPGTISASAIQKRYAMLRVISRSKADRSLIFADLEESPPAEVIAPKAAYRRPVPPGSGAVQPVWLTVRVPADARPGDYKGTVTVSASGQKPVNMAIRLRVVDWRVPDPNDFEHSFLEFIQSPESVAMHYKVKMWSEEHWKLLDRTFRLLGEVSSKMVWITAQRRTHFGNDHGMIRFRKKNGGFEPDLSIADRYLGLAAKYMGGGIKIVSLYAWRCPWGPGVHYRPGIDKKAEDLPVLISVIGPGGELQEVEGPAWGTPECTALWKPVFDGMKRLLAKHGIPEELLMVGAAGDVPPSNTALGTLKEASGGVMWVHEAHVSRNVLGKEKHPVGYCARAWGGDGKHIDPVFCRGYGWKNRLKPWRTVTRESFHIHRLPQLRTRLEAMVTNIIGGGRFPYHGHRDYGTHGIGRLGADFWPVLKGKRGRGKPLAGRFPETAWGQLGMHACGLFFLRPGKDGPIGTAQLEMFREGAQNIEARVFIEKALENETMREKLGAELAARAQKLLDLRTRMAQRGTRTLISAGSASAARTSDWRGILAQGIQERSEQLYALAEEVAGRIGK